MSGSLVNSVVFQEINEISPHPLRRKYTTCVIMGGIMKNCDKEKNDRHVFQISCKNFGCKKKVTTFETVALLL